MYRRAVAQRCPDPPMKNLISLGGQHQGVFGVPKCAAPKHEWCEVMDKLLTHLAYAGYVWTLETSSYFVFYKIGRKHTV